MPDILANSAGVTASYFEWVQDRYGYFWTEKEVNERLEAKMCEAFNAVLQTSLKYNVDMRTAAYIVAINRVATVTRMRGMYSPGAFYYATIYQILFFPPRALFFAVALACFPPAARPPAADRSRMTGPTGGDGGCTGRSRIACPIRLMSFAETFGAPPPARRPGSG